MLKYFVWNFNDVPLKFLTKKLTQTLNVIFSNKDEILRSLRFKSPEEFLSGPSTRSSAIRQWDHVSIMASQIDHNCLFQQLVQANNKENKAPHYWPFMRGNYQSLVLDSPHKGPFMRKVCPHSLVIIQRDYHEEGSHESTWGITDSLYGKHYDQSGGFAAKMAGNVTLWWFDCCVSK